MSESSNPSSPTSDGHAPSTGDRYRALAERALAGEAPSQEEALWILDGEDVELLRSEVGPLGIRLDEDDVLAFFREALGEVESDLSGTDDQHFHVALRDIGGARVK